MARKPSDPKWRRSSEEDEPTQRSSGAWEEASDDRLKRALERLTHAVEGNDDPEDDSLGELSKIFEQAAGGPAPRRHAVDDEEPTHRGDLSPPSSAPFDSAEMPELPDLDDFEAPTFPDPEAPPRPEDLGKVEDFTISVALEDVEKAMAQIEADAKAARSESASSDLPGFTAARRGVKPERKEQTFEEQEFTLAMALENLDDTEAELAREVLRKRLKEEETPSPRPRRTNSGRTEHVRRTPAPAPASRSTKPPPRPKAGPLTPDIEPGPRTQILPKIPVSLDEQHLPLDHELDTRRLAVQQAMADEEPTALRADSLERVPAGQKPLAQEETIVGNVMPDGFDPNQLDAMLNAVKPSGAPTVVQPIADAPTARTPAPSRRREELQRPPRQETPAKPKPKPKAKEKPADGPDMSNAPLRKPPPPGAAPSKAPVPKPSADGKPAKTDRKKAQDWGDEDDSAGMTEGVLAWITTLMLIAAFFMAGLFAIAMLFLIL